MADIAYAVAQLRGRRGLAGAPRASKRLQWARTDHVQMLWQDPSLPRELNERFAELWQRDMAPSADRNATASRELDGAELATAVAELVALAFAEMAAAG